MRGPLARCTLSVALLLGLGAGEIAAQQRPFHHAVPGDAIAFLGFDSVTDLKAGYANSPLGRMWVDPAFDPLRKELGSRIQALRNQITRDLGVDPIELPGMLSGPLAVAVLDAPRTGVGSGQDGTGLCTPLAMCVLADVGDRREDCRSLVNSLMERVAACDEIQSSVEKAGADEVRVLVTPGCEFVPPIELRQTLHGNVLVLTARAGGSARDDLQRLLEGLDGHGPRPLSANPSFANSLAGPDGPNHQRLWMDVSAVLGNSSDELMKKLGLTGLGAFSLSSHCTPNGSHLALRQDWSGEGWIPKVLQKLCVPGDFKLLRCVPADSRAVEAVHADLPGLFDVVVKALMDGKVVSSRDMVGSLTDIEEALGFNPRDDLLELLDGEMVFVTSEVSAEEALPGMTADPQTFTLLMGLKDGRGLQSLVDSKLNASAFRAALQSTDYNGHKLYSISVVPRIVVSYAILDDVAVMSLSHRLLQSMIDLHDGRSGADLASSPALTDMTRQLRPGYGMLGYQDAAGAIRGAIKTLANLHEVLGPAMEQDDWDADEPGAMATADAGEAEAEAQETVDIGPIKIDEHNHHRSHLDLGELEWLLHLPMPDPEIANKYFHGAAVSAVRVDGQSVQIESVGP